MFTTHISSKRISVLFGSLAIACASYAQNEVLYADQIEHAEVSVAHNDLKTAQRCYRLAFLRRPALVQHAIGYARVAWQLKDTSDTRTYVEKALDLGFRGDSVDTDSVLAPFWNLPAASEAWAKWNAYRSMELPALKAELEAMFKEDQAIRMNLDQEKADSQDSLVRRSVWKPVEEQDDRHYRRVVQIIQDRGVPSVHQVGLKGNQMIFFAFIHSSGPEKISPWVLKLQESVQRGDSPAIWYAYVIDRFMVNTIKVTMFGTTGYRDDETGNYFFLTVDPGTTDLLRESVGLPRVGHNGW